MCAWGKPDTQGPLSTKETSIRNQETQVQEVRAPSLVESRTCSLWTPKNATGTSNCDITVAPQCEESNEAMTTASDNTSHPCCSPFFFVPSLNVPSHFHHAAHFAHARHTSLNLTRECYFFEKKVAKSVLTIPCWRGMHLRQ